MFTSVAQPSNISIAIASVTTAEAMQALGKRLGAVVRGGEVFALNGDVGTGKTTFTKGLAAGMGVTDVVQSPTFTIERLYQASGQRQLAHYDFYRLMEPGIMQAELQEVVAMPGNVTVIEWDTIVEDVLPATSTIHCAFSYTTEMSRRLVFDIPSNLKHVVSCLQEIAS